MNPLNWLDRRRAEGNSAHHDAAYERMLHEEATRRATQPDELEKSLGICGSKAEIVGEPRVVWDTPHLTPMEYDDALQGHTLPPERRGHLDACDYCGQLLQAAREHPKLLSPSPRAMAVSADSPLPHLWQRRAEQPPAADSPALPSRRGATLYTAVTRLAVAACVVLVVALYPGIYRVPYGRFEEYASAPDELREMRNTVRKQKAVEQEQTRKLVEVLTQNDPKWKTVDEPGRVIIMTHGANAEFFPNEIGEEKTIPFLLNGHKAYVSGRVDRKGSKLCIVVDSVELPQVAVVPPKAKQ